MRISINQAAVRAFCLGSFVLVALAWGAHGAEAVNTPQSLGDLSAFRAIAADTLVIVNKGDFARAKARIKDLEITWDDAEAGLRPRDPDQWRVIDKAIDAALAALRADKPQAQASKDTLQNLLTILDRPRQGAATAAPSAAPTAKLPITDIIAAAEKLQPGAIVLDVSFEPRDGRPAYAVRTYAKGKAWDGVFDGTSGAVADPGTVVDESALDDEDKAELAALKTSKITLQQAIALAEQTASGSALSAGLEQVRGRAVWEILVQSPSQSRQVHIDPVTGKVM